MDGTGKTDDAATAAADDQPPPLSTREQLIVTAERLFAEKGLAHVSLKEIATQAGQRNNAAVYYHFGDRDQLIRAIIEHRVSFTEELRWRLLEEVLAADGRVSLSDLAGAFVLPVAAQVRPDSHYVPFQARYLVETGHFATEGLGHDFATEGPMRLLFGALGRRLDLPADILNHRFATAMHSTIQTMALHHGRLIRGALRRPLPELIADQIKVVESIFSAGPADYEIDTIVHWLKSTA